MSHAKAEIFEGMNKTLKDAQGKLDPKTLEGLYEELFIMHNSTVRFSEIPLHLIFQLLEIELITRQNVSFAEYGKALAAMSSLCEETARFDEKQSSVHAGPKEVELLKNLLRFLNSKPNDQ